MTHSHRRRCELHLRSHTRRYENDKECRDCISFQMNASDGQIVTSPLSPSDSAAESHPYPRLREGRRSLQRKIHRVMCPVMTEPSHLPFSDINPAHIQGCVFTLENGQRSSSPLLYNCVCSFKCEAENVSLCVPPALFPDILLGQFTSEKDTCLFRRDFGMRH